MTQSIQYSSKVELISTKSVQPHLVVEYNKIKLSSLLNLALPHQRIFELYHCEHYMQLHTEVVQNR